MSSTAMTTAQANKELLTLPIYGAMVTYIKKCNDVDEITKIHAQASALELYAAQAMNTESERLATGVRIRAERRAGELFAEKERATPKERNASGAGGKSGKIDSSNGGTNQSGYAASLASTGVPKQTAHRWQQLARVPAKEFERHLEGVRNGAVPKPSTSAILQTIQNARTADGRKTMPEGALHLWGILRDWEKCDYFSKDPGDLFGGITEAMQQDVRRIVPMLCDWLTLLREEIK